ncbi:MAG TPA: hypothetical protein VGG05_28775 [Pseudonocardiaceae bacterium]|jgi:hypothetical protein
MTDQTPHQWDLLLIVTNDRYGSDRFDTVRRLIDTALRNGRSVQVWACGEVNGLTEVAPVESCCANGEPSTAEQISGLVAEHDGRFNWLACRTCSEERGAGEHIPGLPTPSFANLGEYVNRSAKTVFIGGV